MVCFVIDFLWYIVFIYGPLGKKGSRYIELEELTLSCQDNSFLWGISCFIMQEADTGAREEVAPLDIRVRGFKELSYSVPQMSLINNLGTSYYQALFYFFSQQLWNSCDFFFFFSII